MNSRTDKYYDEKDLPLTRVNRNEELYKDISKTSIAGYEVKPNEEIIGRSQKNIDVEKIKSILDTHYNDAPKRKLNYDIKDESNNVNPLLETKEYDINVIINRAKEEKGDNYEENRNKKLRDTQYDILNNLDLNKFVEDYESEDKPKASGDLQELINTINLKEKEIEEIKNTSIDLFEDLKGSENTEVLSGTVEKTQEQLSKTNTLSIDKSFFTGTNKIKEKDFEDFEDFEDLAEKGFSTIGKILIILLVIIFIVGVYILVKAFI